MQRQSSANKIEVVRTKTCLDMREKAGWPLLIERKTCHKFDMGDIHRLSKLNFLEQGESRLNGLEIRKRVCERWPQCMWGFREAEFLLDNKNLLPSSLQPAKLLFLAEVWEYPVHHRPIVLCLCGEFEHWYPGYELLEFERGDLYALPVLASPR